MEDDATYCTSCGTKSADVDSPLISQYPREESKQDIPKQTIKDDAAKIISFVVATVVWSLVGSFVSETTVAVLAQNVATTIIALLIGCYSLKKDVRNGLSTKAVFFLFLTYIPISFIGAAFSHDALLSNPQSSAHMYQMLYSIVIAIIFYQVIGKISVSIKNEQKRERTTVL